MWYGVLGGKEILQKTFKNLDQRVQLECDGQRIPLPSLQGIVIMNIPRLVAASAVAKLQSLGGWLAYCRTVTKRLLKAMLNPYKTNK